MQWMNRVAELTGYCVILIAAFGICGTTAAWVNDLIRRAQEDPYPEYGWSREIPRHNSMWDQLEAAAASEIPAPVLAADDTPGEPV